MRLIFSRIQCLIQGPPLLGLEKNFQIKVLRGLVKCCFEIGFCKCSILKYHFTYLLSRIYRICVVFFRVQSLRKGPPWLDLEKTFHNKVLRRLENTILILLLQRK